MSTCEQLGQGVGIRTAADDSCRRVVADRHLPSSPEFIELPRLRGHRTTRLVQVTGGPVGYSGRAIVTRGSAD